jgi:hypothetical protein
MVPLISSQKGRQFAALFGSHYFPLNRAFQRKPNGIIDRDPEMFLRLTCWKPDSRSLWKMHNLLGRGADLG